MKQEIIALILADGKEKKADSLTYTFSKPTINFGGKYKAIDFTLSNCANSMIKKIGILSQYETTNLSEYVGNGQKWGLDANGYSCILLTPYQKGEKTYFYKGSADAIYKHISFIDKFEPDYILVTSANHIYKMDYSKMLQYHKSKKADVTVSTVTLANKAAYNCEYISLDDNYKITEITNKKSRNKFVTVSMNVYIFKYSIFKKYLKQESTNLAREVHNINEHILPEMIYDKCKIYAYPFDGYWKEICDTNSFWEANMDLLNEDKLNLFNSKTNWKIYTEDTISNPQYIGKNAVLSNSIINQGCFIEGEIEHSILANDVIVGKKAKVIDSVLLPGSVVQDGAVIKKCILTSNTIIHKNEKPNKDQSLICVISGGVK